MRFRMVMLSRTFLFIGVLFGHYLVITLSAQEKAKHAAPNRTRAQCSVNTANLAITAQQQNGLRLLKSAQAEAAGLQPEMRAFVLWQASHGCRKVNAEQADSLLQDALRVTLSFDKSGDRCTHGEVELCGVSYWLQTRVLQDVILQSAQVSDIQSLLARVESEVRQRVDPYLFDRYVRQKRIDDAFYLLQKMANDSGYFSYRRATELIKAAPPELSSSRLQVFSEAMGAYRQHAEEKYPSPDDPATMVLSVWQDLPQSAVLDAIDQILVRAKDVDDDTRGTNRRVGIATGKGDAYFASIYEFRLYELAPVLEQLDKARAESLLDRSSEVKAELERYPEGIFSMNASAQSAGMGHLPHILSIGSVDATRAAAQQARHELFRLEQRIIAELEDDPRQALADAMSLPLNSGPGSGGGPRIFALSSLAQISVKTNPAVSSAALAEIRKSAANMVAGDQAQVLEELPELYLELGDDKGAENSLHDLVEIAEKLYARDSDLNDPNQAFKGMWPSANLWRQCLSLAAKFSPRLAETIMEQIPDPEIKILEKVTYANSLLGAGTERLSTVEKHGGGITNFISAR